MKTEAGCPELVMQKRLCVEWDVWLLGTENSKVVRSAAEPLPLAEERGRLNPKKAEGASTESQTQRIRLVGQAKSWPPVGARGPARN